MSAADVSNLNQGAYAQFENEVSEWVNLGGRVEFDVELAYSGGSKAPDAFFSYTVLGADGGVLFKPIRRRLLNQPGQEFQRTSVEDIGRILEFNQTTN